MNNSFAAANIPCRIYIPDWCGNYEKPYCAPPVYPFLDDHQYQEDWFEKYGDYVNKVKIVETIADCDAVLLMYELGYYYKKKKLDVLKTMNEDAIRHHKPFVCWVKGDPGITPQLRSFHLYRQGGYKSKNRGNQFSVPVFIKDPLPDFFNGQISIKTTKPDKPLIGFCGQGKAGLGKVAADIARGLKTRIDKLLGKYPFDVEAWYSSTYMRSMMLDRLEKSDLVDTRFIRHTKYRAGSTSEIEKKETSKIFFKNMGEADYIICYRGAGNFSVRLFETMASGKIPVIITSNNNLPLEDKIEWNIFPVIPENKWKCIDKRVAAFHGKLSTDDFISLQYQSRQLWQNYLSYKGFFSHWPDRYMPKNQTATS
ncbi:MAG: glycosyltransferase family 47 protein [Bacteroidota bacterium]|nr:glycosyltransferase family 47 protein [Bacteroidota bacterium]